MSILPFLHCGHIFEADTIFNRGPTGQTGYEKRISCGICWRDNRVPMMAKLSPSTRLFCPEIPLRSYLENQIQEVDQLRFSKQGANVSTRWSSRYILEPYSLCKATSCLGAFPWHFSLFVDPFSPFSLRFSSTLRPHRIAPIFLCVLHLCLRSKP